VFYKGEQSNVLKDTHPIYNVEVSKLRKAKEYFRKLPDIPQMKKQKK